MTDGLDNCRQKHDEKERLFRKIEVSPRRWWRLCCHGQTWTYTQQTKGCDDEGDDSPAYQCHLVAISVEAECVDWR